MKRITAFLVLSVLYIILSSHEFWLQPKTFILKKGEKVSIKFMVGESFVGENWAGNRSKINFLTLHTHSGTKDIAPFVSENNGDSLQLAMEEEGTPVIVYNGLNSFLELEAAKFNEYLEEDGLHNAIEYRKQHNETDSMGHEYYQRSVKTIVQVGTAYNNVCTKPTILPLDIVPVVNPYNIEEGSPILLRVFFNKKPLVGQLIKIWKRVDGKTVLTENNTDNNGMITIYPLKKSGRWMVSTVKMIRLENDPKAQWQSYWGSCTWGYE